MLISIFLTATGVIGQFLSEGSPSGSRAAERTAGCGDQWDTTFTTNGANGPVHAMVADGSGNIYIGGNFTTVQGVPASRIAKWNGSEWSALGVGVGGPVNSIAISGSDVYVGGNFGTAGGSPARNVAKWNGTAWSALGAGLGGGTHVVESVAVFGNDVYFGGNFSVSGGSPANGLVRWNGTSFFDAGVNGQVYTLAVNGGSLYVGGFVVVTGDNTQASLLKWNGTAWSSFGLLNTGTVRSIGFRGNEIFVGGAIRAPGVSADIARHNGTTWTSLGTFQNSPTVRAIVFSGTDVYAGGTFERSGGVGIGNGILKHNGTQWSAIGSGTEFGNHDVRAILVSGNTLYLGGDFRLAGGIAASNLATLSDGTTWGTPFPETGPDNAVNAIAVSGNDISIGGTFLGVGPVTANRIAKWNGVTNTWSSLGGGITGFGTESSHVSAIAVAGGKVYAGGSFPRIGGVTASNIAVWNGTTWAPLGTGITGGNGRVSVIIVRGEDVYVGGDFATADGVAANRVAKWNGTSWSGLNSTIIPTAVTSMAFKGDDLYVGTGTTTAANPAYFTKYDGTNWTALGADLGDRGVSSIAVIGDDIYVGGGFITVNGVTVNRIVKWNGSSWSALGGGLPPASFAINGPNLAVAGNHLIASGDFTTATGGPGDRIARWNGTGWTPMSTGLNANANALLASGGDIFAGGPFTTAGCNQSPYFARWRETVWNGGTSSDWHTAGNWGGSNVPAPNAGISIGTNDVSITSADVTVSSLIVTGGRTVTVGSGRTLTVSGNLDLSSGSLAGPGSVVVNGDLNLNQGTISGLTGLTVNGNLYLSGGTIIGNGTVSLTACRSSALAGGSATSFINSPLTRCVNSTGTYRFPVGSNGLYAPVELSGIAGSGNFTVEPKTGAFSGAASGLPANRLQRWWNTISSGITQGDLVFNYLDAEVVGIEGRYRAYRINGGTAELIPTVLNRTTNRATVSGTTSFAAWTLAEGPATFELLKGRITTPQNRPAGRVILSLTDSEGNVRWTLTNPFGYYRFPDVETWKTYTIRLQSKRFTFASMERSVDFTEANPDVNFVSTDH